MKLALQRDHTMLALKIKEAACSVLPIILMVAALCFTVLPVQADVLLSFLVGAVLVVVGTGLFSLGAEASMVPIGAKLGAALTKTKKLWLILPLAFVLGFAVTVAEPDLQVLAQTVPHINSAVLLITVGVGVGLFLAVCMLRILTGLRLRYLLLGCYAVIFVLAAFSSPDFLCVAFDSGGVTTGPMTVPFILALGVGVANIRSDRSAKADSFGLVALCSVGPILAVLILGLFYNGSSTVAAGQALSFATTADLGRAYLLALPKYLGEMALALLPIIVIFLLFAAFVLHLSKRRFLKILVGLLYTYLGLVLFLTGVNVGFAALGAVLGELLITQELKLFGVVLAAAFGWFIISAEPAVGVLETQIEEVSAGSIPGAAIKYSLSAAVALAFGLSMLRVVTGISLLWFLVPGYAAALLLSFFVPDIYTAIAFDSGGVASGPMTATFMLQFMIGACGALGGNILQDAFGIVALVALMPLISIQIVGLIFERKGKAAAKQPYGDLDIIELWEDAA